MNYSEAIEKRRSVRTYSPEPADADSKKAIVDLIDRYNNEGGMSIRFLDDGSAAFKRFSKSFGMIKNATGLIILAGKRGDPHLGEKAGHYGELLILEATERGLGTCFVAGFDRSAIASEEDEEITIVITVGYPADKPRAREKFIGAIVGKKDGEVEKFLTHDQEPPAWVIAGVSAAIRAPSAMNHKPVRFDYKNGTLTASVQKDTAMTRIDLGAAKANFEVAAEGKFELGNGGRFVKI
jgi:hypothetical protein